MYRIKVYDRFASAHFLDGYEGKCESLHGHNWKVEVELQGKRLDDIGMLMDFKKLKELLRTVLDKLDHCLLNDLDPFKDSNPSSENISKYIHDSIRDRLPEGISIYCVSVWESENSVASYIAD